MKDKKQLSRISERTLPKRSLAQRGKPRRPSRPNKTNQQKKRSVAKRSTTNRKGTKRRVRPAVRAANRKAKLQQARPMPKPPARRPVARQAAVAPALSDELRTQIDEIQARFATLEGEAQLSDIYTDIGYVDTQLVELPLAIDALQARGYVHSGLLEDKLEALDDSWDEIRPRVERMLETQIRRLDQELDETERQVDRLQRANAAKIRAADTAVEALSSRVNAARTAVASLYESSKNELDNVSYQLDKIQQMMEALEASQEFRLYETEGPLLLVESEWQRDGKEGPEGILCLTDQRLLFELREEIVTKKRFGLFKAESEKLQDLLLEVPVQDIESVEHKEEGGFLGMGKADILELVFAATASVSRARFHLKGQESSDWATMIKRVQTGEIDEERADETIEALEMAAEMAAAFPTVCPNCFAAVPPPPRGVTSVTCEFCSTTITAVAE